MTGSTSNQSEQTVHQGDKLLSKRANELYHNFQAEHFNRLHRRRHRVESRFWRDLVAPSLIRSGATFGVDLCSGAGFVPRVLLGAVGPSVRIMCIDLSDEALNRARVAIGALADRAEFRAGDAAEIPLADASVDWVSLNAGLHHIPDPQSVLKEIDRVLKPGGCFCLGHEPNAAFFSSRFLVGMERFIWHMFWYLSPIRNVQRVARRFGWRPDDYGAHEYLDAINEALISEELITEPLKLRELHQIVDVHTPGGEKKDAKKGFSAPKLIEDHFSAYEVEALYFSDYGGEMLRRHGLIRWIFDGLMRLLRPGKGRLFSWILRKKNQTQRSSSEAW